MSWQVIDAEQATDWITSQLTRPGGFSDPGWTGNWIDCALPAGYAAYIKIFHEILEDLSEPNRDLTWDEWDKARTKPPPASPEEERIERLLSTATLGRSSPSDDFPARRIRWSELAERYGLRFHAGITCSSFSRKFRNGSWPKYLVGPDEGTLADAEFEALLECLTATIADEDVFMFWGLSRITRGEEPYCIRGNLAEPGLPWPPKLRFTPEYMWSESRSWIVHSDYDSPFSLVSGTEALAELLQRTLELEAVRVPFRTRIDGRSDTLNAS